jgi:hypothetical protein
MRHRILAVLVLGAGLVVVPAAPAAALSGVERVVNVSASTSDDKLIHAYCPRGKAAVGGGARISGPGEPFVHLTTMAPLGPDGFAARAEEYRTHTPLNWELTTWAVCATPPPGLTYRSAASTPGSKPVEATYVNCPDDTTVIGLGAEITYGAGQVMLHDMHTDYAFSDVFVQAVEDRNGYRPEWTLTAYAICADEQTRIASGESALDVANPKGNVAPCELGRHNAVGFRIFGPIGVLGINDVMVADVTYGATAYMFPLGQPPGSSWQLTTFTICVD